jgi:tetratricopeptide (TPR) repeat protein
MRYLTHGCAVSLLVMVLIFPRTLQAEQMIQIHPDKPQEVITVQAGTDFDLTLEGKGWYLNRYDRNLLSFQVRRVEAASTTIVMRGLETGTAQLVLSKKQIDIPLIVVIVEEKVESTSILNRADALRERGLVEEQSQVQDEAVEGIEQSEITEEAAAASTEQLQQEEIRTERVEQKTLEPPKQKTETDDEALYYVDENNRIVNVPRVHEEDYYRRGRRYYKRGKYDEATVEFQLYISNCETCRRMDSTRLMLADIALQSQDENEAFAQLEEVIHSGGDTSVLSALKIRAPLYRESGEFESALSDYEEIYRRESSNHDILLTLGDLNYELEHTVEALGWYEKSIAVGVADDEIIYRVAGMYDSPGNERDIEKAYEYYLLITEKYLDSIYHEAALKRVQFFESNFYDYQ